MVGEKSGPSHLIENCVKYLGSAAQPLPFSFIETRVEGMEPGEDTGGFWDRLSGPTDIDGLYLCSGQYFCWIPQPQKAMNDDDSWAMHHVAVTSHLHLVE